MPMTANLILLGVLALALLDSFCASCGLRRPPISIAKPSCGRADIMTADPPTSFMNLRRSTPSGFMLSSVQGQSTLRQRSRCAPLPQSEGIAYHLPPSVFQASRLNSAAVRGGQRSYEDFTA